MSANSRTSRRLPRQKRQRGSGNRRGYGVDAIGKPRKPSIVRQYGILLLLAMLIALQARMLCERVESPTEVEAVKVTTLPSFELARSELLSFVSICRVEIAFTFFAGEKIRIDRGRTTGEGPVMKMLCFD